MDKNLNYYSILNINHKSSDKEIKKSYYKLSFKYHPDRNKDIDNKFFNQITDAYNIFSDKSLREEYDNKSIYGKNYDESLEIFDLNYDFDYDSSKQKLEDFKKNQINNIQINVDDSFDGNISYKRWVKCNICDGTGKDLSSKIKIKDNNGNVIKTFDADDGCDFCEGTGKDYNNNPCSFCLGKGKIGINNCEKCGGDGRVLGIQKIKDIELKDGKIKINSMGHFSKSGNIGYLLIVKKN